MKYGGCHQLTGMLKENTLIQATVIHLSRMSSGEWSHFEEEVVNNG